MADNETQPDAQSEETPPSDHSPDAAQVGTSDGDGDSS